MINVSVEITITDTQTQCIVKNSGFHKMLNNHDIIKMLLYLLSFPKYNFVIKKEKHTMIVDQANPKIKPGGVHGAF